MVVHTARNARPKMTVDKTARHWLVAPICIVAAAEGKDMLEQCRSRRSGAQQRPSATRVAGNNS
jgi:hypothetical protein